MYKIRPIQKSDNKDLGNIVRDTLAEFGCVGEGYASNDAEVDDLYGYYQQRSAIYYVVESWNGEVWGGAGIARLKGTRPEEGICEFQKCYLVPHARGIGAGKKLLEMLRRDAELFGYEEMYLETVPQLKPAIGLYEKYGFQMLDNYKGNTGHAGRCSVRMSLMLAPMPADSLG